MSSTPATEHHRTPHRHGARPARPAGPTGRRVRHQAQDVVAVMVFSGLLSCACAVALLLLAQLGR